MANAIKHISVQRGYDVTEYTLCCFGGAGGQHACLVADALGMTRVFIHPLAGVLSAYGMGLADVRALRQQAVEARLSDAALDARRRRAFAALERGGARRARGAGHRARRASTRARTLHLKYEGTDTTLELAAGGDVDAARRASSSSATGSSTASSCRARALVIEAIARRGGRPHAVGGRRSARVRAARRGRCAPLARNRVYTRGRVRTTRRSTTAPTCVPATRSTAPRSSASATRTTVVEPGWRATLTARDHLVLERVEAPRARARDRHDGRSGAARGVQQPVHVDRRADGRDARQHRVLGQHQGAARLLLRAVRRATAT